MRAGCSLLKSMSPITSDLTLFVHLLRSLKSRNALKSQRHAKMHRAKFANHLAAGFSMLPRHGRTTCLITQQTLHPISFRPQGSLAYHSPCLRNAL